MSDRRAHVFVDTDMGADDVMALLYLLRRPDVAIDAVTVDGDGLAHCAPGSLVREAPEGFIETGFLSADAGASTIGAVDVDVGTWAVVCIVDARAGAARVWPGGSFSVRSTG